jgi:hypothetical protein
MPDLPLHPGSRWNGDIVVDSEGAQIAIEWIDEPSDYYLAIDDHDGQGVGVQVADILAVLNRAGLLDSLFAERDKTIAELRARVEDLTNQVDEWKTWAAEQIAP